MALDPENRDLLKIFADPSISPADKQRLLSGAGSDIPAPQPLPPEVSGLPAGAVAGPGGGGDAGDRAAIDAAMVQQQAAPAPASPAAAPPGGIPTAPPPGGFISDPTVANKGGIPGAVAQLQASAPQTVPDPDAPPAPGAAPAGAPAPDDARAAIRLIPPPPTGPVVPMESVRQSTSTAGSTVDPTQIAELKDAAEKRDAAEMQSKVAEARIAQQSGDIQTAADAKAQAEKIALAATRDTALKRMDQVMQQRDKISDEVINSKPAQPDLWAGKNFGEKLMTMISVVFTSLGAGALGDPKLALNMFEKMANRQVDQQQAELAQKRGAMGELDTVYARHLANLGDHELAKQQTIADIYGKASADITKMIQDSNQTPDSPLNRKLLAQKTAFDAARQEQLTDIQAKYGGQVHQEEAIAFTRKHLDPKAAGAAAPGAPAAAPQPGAVVAPGQVVPNVNRDAKPAKPDDAINRAAALWGAGQHRAALATLPPTVLGAVQAQATRQEKRKGLGDGATHEDYLMQALEDMSGGQFKTPESFIPESARKRFVQIPGGGHAFAASEEQAGKAQELFNDDAQLIGAYNAMAQLTKLPAAEWTPDIRARIQAISATIKPLTSKSLGMSRLEKDLYNGISGDDINGVKDFMLGTGKAQVDQALKLAKSRVRATASSLSSTWQDSNPVGIR